MQKRRLHLSATDPAAVRGSSLGIKIPEQVAVLGVDNDPVICDCVQVPLSSVRHDLEGLAYEAAALLDRLMNGEPAPGSPKRIMPKGIVTRKSTDILAVEDPEVGNALTYIRDNFRRANLSVDDWPSSFRATTSSDARFEAQGEGNSRRS